ncbi:MAG: DUF2784 domain-containing protein [Acidobacteriota bacterium]|jgi:hypothetical protein
MNIYLFLADFIVIIHLGFAAFVTAGALLVLKRRWVAWLHLPAAAWGALVEYAGLICPLTPLENRLRLAGGSAAYRGDFIQHYLIPVLYPAGLTREIQILLGTFVVLINAGCYGWIVWRAVKRRRPR